MRTEPRVCTRANTVAASSCRPAELVSCGLEGRAPAVWGRTDTDPAADVAIAADPGRGSSLAPVRCSFATARAVKAGPECSGEADVAATGAGVASEFRARAC